MPNQTLKINTADLVDRLGAIKAQIADLEKGEADLREQLIKSGAAIVEGKLFKATVVTNQYTTVDRKAVIEALPPSASLTRLINKFSTTDSRTTVKVVSR